MKNELKERKEQEQRAGLPDPFVQLCYLKEGVALWVILSEVKRGAPALLRLPP